MKSIKQKKLFILLLILFIPVLSIADGYKIKVKINGLQDSLIRLAYHFGDKQYIKDSVRLDKTGVGIFEGKEDLPGGIYLVVMPTNNYFEMVVTEQKFSVETDLIDLTQKAKFTSSEENRIFNDYQKYMIKKQQEASNLRDRATNNKDNADSTRILKEKQKALEMEVDDYRIKLMKDFPKSFTTKILRTMKEPDVPPAPKDSAGNIDSTFAYRYFKFHYLDDVDFSDDRLLRTPLLQQKIKVYTENLTIQMPDSIIPSVDTIIERSRANKEVFKYCVVTLTNYYETSKIMGFDEVFVHLASKYYLTGDAYWADSTLKAKIAERVNKISPNIIGKSAVNLNMWDTSGVRKSLYDIRSKYTVLVFWDPTCGHCKIEIPKLKTMYDSLHKVGMDIEVYGVGIEADPDLWKAYIKEHQLNWINVTDLYNATGFRNYYDIYSTPVVYLLDEKKKIVAKRISVEQIAEMLHKFYQKSEPGKLGD